jgi:uncharacterized protein
MRDRLRHDLTAAMKARDAIAISALRSAIAAIDNAEAVDVRADGARPATSEHIAGATEGAGSAEAPRRVLTQAEVEAVIRAQVDERVRTAEEYEALGRGEMAERLRGEARVLLGYVSP